MGLRDRFRRNRQQSVLPDEVKEYYQTENRQRRGMAALLAVAAVIVTLLIAAALFFGGRFVYNQIRGDDSETVQPIEENGENQDQAGEAGDTNGQDSGQLPGNDDETPAPAPDPGATGQPGTSPSTPSNPEQPAPAPAPGTTPSLGDEPLPHTGDPGM